MMLGWLSWCNFRSTAYHLQVSEYLIPVFYVLPLLAVFTIPPARVISISTSDSGSVLQGVVEFSQNFQPPANLV